MKSDNKIIKAYFIRKLLATGMTLKYIYRKMLVRCLSRMSFEETIKYLRKKGYQYDIDETLSKKVVVEDVLKNAIDVASNQMIFKDCEILIDCVFNIPNFEKEIVILQVVEVETFAKRPTLHVFYKDLKYKKIKFDDCLSYCSQKGLK